MATRRVFTREFKVEAVRLVRERGVTIAQAARDLGIHEKVLRKWVRALAADPLHAFPGQGQLKPELVLVQGRFGQRVSVRFAEIIFGAMATSPN
jgi:transposase